MARAKKAGKAVDVTFERTDGAKKRLPTRAEMRGWMLYEAGRSLVVS